ncbi:hypothetical protein RB600_006476 [Gaeumannomyces tritici]
MMDALMMDAPTTVPVLPSHQFYNDGQLLIGHSRYPTTPGHALAIVQSGTDLFSLGRDEFVNVLTKISKAASLLCARHAVECCALVADGGSSLSLLPLHGLGEDWRPVNSMREFHKSFPGYISSKDGPMMLPIVLDDIFSKIQAVSGLSAPFDYRFDGAEDDTNLFARIIRGEVPERRVWEDDHHVAFLTVFANTPGVTVLAPRKHLPGDIFSIDTPAFSELMRAAHRVAGILKEAFGTSRCGMIFEGFGIDYAHVKLIPIHVADAAGGDPGTAGPTVTVAPFLETYQGYVTSLNGPLLEDSESLARTTLDVRNMYRVEPARPPRSWALPLQHLSFVLRNPWYKNLFLAQDALFHTSVTFFREKLGYKYCFVPATTNAVSSRMGLGSDSEPAPVLFLGQEIHLADSMQFSLECILRIQDGVPGVYHVNTSFRGENPNANPDAMHLNRSYHVECELLGSFSKGIEVAEAYVNNLVSTLLRDHEELVKTTVGSTDHLRALLELSRSHGGKLPRISVDGALELPVMDGSCWKYVLASDPSRGRTLTRAGKLKLIEHFGGAVWVTEMYHLGVPFYQAFLDETHTKARCADLLLGNEEVLGLGERHVLAEDVLAALREREVSVDNYAWYTEIRELKPILTTGWGMDIERFLAWVFQHDDVRDMTLVPRMEGFSLPQ